MHSQRLGQDQRVLQRHGRTFGHVGRCRVRGIANQHHTALNPGVDDDLLDGREVDRVEALELAEDSGHRVGEFRKERQESVQITSSGVLGCDAREICIAVRRFGPTGNTRNAWRGASIAVHMSIALT